MSDLFALMTARGFSPRKNGSGHGGEFVSACPGCGDGGKGVKSDRFHIWPNKQTGGLGSGWFWCRGCNISGDTIAFLQKFHGLAFPEACNQLGITLPGRQSAGGSRRYQPPPVIPVQQGWQPTTYPEPCRLWQEKAVTPEILLVTPLFFSEVSVVFPTCCSSLFWLADCKYNKR